MNTKPIEDHELIDLYLLDRLNKEERANFESRLKIDSEFSAEYESHKLIMKFVNQSETNKLRSGLYEHDRKLPDYRPGQKKAGTQYLLAIAASVLVVISSFYFILSYISSTGLSSARQHQVENKLFVKYFKPPVDIIKFNTRGNSLLSDNSNFIMAMDDYDKKDFADAKLIFDQLLVQGYDSPNLLFYSSVCDIVMH
ncbi:MAG: hypothetical protein NTW49_12595, partial [Bacteroidia bacterium]|nr:hypothetical protein [Bacteroidia bacterium]